MPQVASPYTALGAYSATKSVIGCNSVQLKQTTLSNRQPHVSTPLEFRDAGDRKASSAQLVCAAATSLTGSTLDPASCLLRGDRKDHPFWMPGGSPTQMQPRQLHFSVGGV